MTLMQQRTVYGDTTTGKLKSAICLPDVQEYNATAAIVALDDAIRNAVAELAKYGVIH